MSDIELRRQLVERLCRHGDIRSAEWRSAVEAVPRHLFVPEFFLFSTAGQRAMWEPVTRENTDPERLISLAYQDETLVTQIDGRIRPHDVSGPVPAGNPTSSSTLPGLVVAMLEDLQIADGHRVLEIGTGSGYSTALLCERLGSENVVSIEADSVLATSAAAAIHGAGYQPTLIAGNGLEEHPGNAPYDRVIATCSVRSIPPAWINQCKPGAIILTTISGWQYGSGYTKLTVGSGGSAAGCFLAPTYSFMLARSCMPPAAQVPDTAQADNSTPRPAIINPAEISGWTARFVAQLAAPAAQCVGKSINGGPVIDYYLDDDSGDIASLTLQADGTYLVRESNSTGPWSRIEQALTEWKAAGAPDISQFRIDITADRQSVSVPGSPALTWDLPL